MTIRTFMIATIATAAMAGTALAEEPWFVDTDGKPGMSLDEYNGSFDNSGDFDSWDSDKDGMISRDEHRAGTWTRSDRNADGNLDDDEMTGLNDAIKMGAPQGK